MANTKTSELVAKRWAKALMELAQEDETISKNEILENLKSVIDVINSSNELKNVIENPSISVEEKQIVLCKLFEGKVLSVVYNFLFVLNLRKRFLIIPEITEEFQKELEKINNIERVSVVSAISLDDEKKAEITKRISEKLKKDVIIDWSVDSNIIAGLIFNINDTVVDNSVKQKLEDITKKIMI